MDFKINDAYRTLPERWSEYRHEEIRDIKVYKDSQWVVVTNGFCEIYRPTLLAGNYPGRGPVFDNGKHIDDECKRYLTILDAETIHLQFEHNRGIGEGFHAKLSPDEARRIGQALIKASEMSDMEDGKIQSFRVLISAPQWIINQSYRHVEYTGWDNYVRIKNHCNGQC